MNVLATTGPGTSAYLIVAAALFAIGLAGMLGGATSS